MRTVAATASRPVSLACFGAYRDAAVGVYPLGNGYRTYLPGLMRFGAPDSLSPFGRGGVNPYGYCDGDPVNRVDPSGHAPFNMMETGEAVAGLEHASGQAGGAIGAARARVAVGDLIYGTGYPGRDGARNEYASRPGFEWTTKEISTIDQYYVIDYERTQAALQKLPRSEYEDAFMDAVRSHPKYGAILEAPAVNRDVWARKSKAGLSWATHSDDPRMRVHFLLDGIDMSAVVAKKGNYGRSIISRELRWLYRNRLDPRVQAGVQFWLWGNPVAPPWTREYGMAVLKAEYGDTMHEFSDADVERAVSGPPALWSRYEPKRAPDG